MFRMNRLARRHTLHLWIALLAILFSALAPTISHALASAGAATPAMQLCTVNGYQMVKLADADADDRQAPADAKSMQHCAFCTLHGGADALPISTAAALALTTGRGIYPPRYYSAPRAQHIWSAAHQRAPPFLA